MKAALASVFSSSSNNIRSQDNNSNLHSPTNTSYISDKQSVGSPRNSPSETPQERNERVAVHKSNSAKSLSSSPNHHRRNSNMNNNNELISNQQPQSQYSTQSTVYDVSALGFHPAARIAPLVEPTVWHFFTPLAQQTNAVNLGQGFPGWSPPKFVQDAAARAVNEIGHTFLANQYARSAGDMNLVQQLAQRYTTVLGRPVDPLTEIVVTDGATGALFCCIEGFINRGDEVIVFEPAFDIYIAQVEMAGGILRPVPLRYSKNMDGNLCFTFDINEFEKTINSRTRMLILNTPHNPTGKIFTRDELEAISRIIQKYPKVIVLTDEVYEHMCYTHPHINIASLPGMYDRTITVSSAGKTFSVTGWKIGWIIAPAHLARAVAVTIQWQVFSVATPLQIAVAEALRVAQSTPYHGFPSFFSYLRDFYLQKRDYLVNVLRSVGLKPIIPEGGFFIIADTSDINFPIDPSLAHLPRDWQFCVAGNTRISMSSGCSRTIDSMNTQYPQLLVSYTELDEHGITHRPALQWLDQGQRECIELVLQDGRTITCTPDHQLYTTTGWVQAQHIVLNSSDNAHRLVCGIEGPLDNVSESDVYQYNLLHCNIVYDLQNQRDHVLAISRILGHLASDGNVQRAGGNDSWSYTARFNLSHLIDVADVKRDLVLLGLSYNEGHAVGTQTTDGWIGDTYYIEIRGLFVRDINMLLSGGLEQYGKRLDTAIFPPFVHDAPTCVVREFLSTYFGGGGGAPAINSPGEWNSITFCIRSSGSAVSQKNTINVFTNLINVIQQHFNGIKFTDGGVYSRLQSHHDNYEYSIKLTAASTLPFYEYIGFKYCCHKQVRLMCAATYYRSIQLAADQRQYIQQQAKIAHQNGNSWSVSRDIAIEELKSYYGYVYSDSVIPSDEALCANNSDESLGEIFKSHTAQHSGMSISNWINITGCTSYFRPAGQVGNSRPRVYSVPRSRSTLPYMTLSVLCRRDVGLMPTYDISMDAQQYTECNFLANGVVVHNCKWTTTDLGVAAIPPSSFYSAENRYLASNTARFAFCKPDDVLQEAAKRLSKIKNYIRKNG